MSHCSCPQVSDEVIEMITDTLGIDYYPVTINPLHQDGSEVSLDDIFDSYLDSNQAEFKNILDELIMYETISDCEARLIKTLWDVRSKLLNGIERDTP